MPIWKYVLFVLFEFVIIGRLNRNFKVLLLRLNSWQEDIQIVCCAVAVGEAVWEGVMADSDEELDKRNSREKFRPERNDYERRSDDRRAREPWEDRFSNL